MNYEPTKRRQRRNHSSEFKAQLVDQCPGGASLSAIAVDNDINPNLLRRWVLEHERLGLHALDDTASVNSPRSGCLTRCWAVADLMGMHDDASWPTRNHIGIALSAQDAVRFRSQFPCNKRIFPARKVNRW